MTDATLAPSDQAAGARASETPVSLSSGYTKYALGLLLCIYIVNFLDRQVVTILAEPIKKDLHLADWQIGMMSGFAFALFYTVLGLPIARLAERKNRPLIIASALTAWSGFTALCGTAQGFAQLCLYRVGVGVGEAGCTPPAHSLITDYTPKAKRASALSFYSMGTPIGTLAGMAIGGIVADQYGWRVAFFVAGTPGLVLAAVAALTLKETRSKIKADIEASAAHRATVGETMAVLARKRTFWLLSLASALSAFVLYGNAPFLPAFFLRNHAAEVAAMAAQFSLKPVGFIGMALGVISGVTGALSSIIGGWICDRTAAKDVRDTMIAPIAAALIGVPTSILVVLMGGAEGALWAYIIPAFTYYFWYGPVYSTTQGIVPPHMRATAAAVLLFMINLIGLGFGPLLVGACSDFVSKGLGMGAAEGVRWALIANAMVGLIAAGLYWMARKTIREEMES